MESRKIDTKENDAVTFEQAMEIIGTGYFQYKLTLIGGIIILTSYLTGNLVAFIIPVAQCDLHMSSEDKGRFASVFFIGVILTCHLWGFLSDTLGRRYILIRCLFVDGMLYFITMLTPNFYVILFLRFINGITSCGGIVSAYAYIGEFQTNKFKSLSLMIASFLASLAYIIMPSVAWLILPAKWQFELYPGQTIRPWKLFYILCGVPSLVSSLALFFMPESPKFLLAKGKKQEVIGILHRMYRENHGKSHNFPIKNITANEAENVGKLDSNVNKTFAVLKLLWNQTAPLLKKPHRYSFVLLIVCFFCTVFCNNGMYVWLPPAINKMEIYKSETGKTDGTYCDVLQYKKEQFNNYSDYYKPSVNTEKENSVNKLAINKITERTCNDDVDTSVYFTYILLGIFLTTAWIFVTIINKFCNKKYLMLALLLITLSSMISMKISNDLITVPIKASIVIVTSGSIFPILNTVVVDFFPTNLRAMAGCLTMLMCRMGSVTAHTTSGSLIESLCDILLWLYIIIITANFVSVSLLPILPSDKSENKQLEKYNEDA